MSAGSPVAGVWAASASAALRKAGAPAPRPTPAPRPASPCPARRQQTYLAALAWAFALFNTTRMLAYVPTLWAIRTHGDSSQH